MNKFYFSLIVILLLQLTSCDPYGANKERDFQMIENELSKNLKVHSIKLKDSKDLLIKVKSPFKETQESFENFASVAQYIIYKNYKPNTLSLDKNIIIEMTDTLDNNYKTSTDIKSIFHLKKFFDKTFAHLNSIFNPDYIGKETIISNFHKTDCFKQLITDDIQSANIIGLHKNELGEVNVIVLADGNEEHYLYIDYNGYELEIIKCLSEK